MAGDLTFHLERKSRRNEQDGHDSYAHRKDRNREQRSERERSPRSFRRSPNRDRDRREEKWGKKEKDEAKVEKPAVQKEEPNYNASGVLAADQNTYKGVVLKYSEPPEARMPPRKFRLYVFKGKEQIDLLHVHRQSAYLLGRDRLVADIPIDHPSCSKQHAALQYRQIVSTSEFGDITQEIKPYIIDLESTNGTFVNGERLPSSRYVELKISDVIKFGESQREYVFLCEDEV